MKCEMEQIGTKSIDSVGLTRRDESGPHGPLQTLHDLGVLRYEPIATCNVSEMGSGAIRRQTFGQAPEATNSGSAGPGMT